MKDNSHSCDYQENSIEKLCICPVHGLHYKDQYRAEQFHELCAKHKAASLGIAAHPVDSK